MRDEVGVRRNVACRLPPGQQRVNNRMFVPSSTEQSVGPGGDTKKQDVTKGSLLSPSPKPRGSEAGVGHCP